jgi:hypothetical protein
MAWRLTVGGVDQTAAVDSFTTTVSLNDRARATVIVGDVMPARYAELISYAPDGVTPLFGGLILQRSFLGRNPYDPTYQLTLEVGDWFTYADWCYSTKAYPVAVTLKQVLADLVVEHLAQYGISLDPAQVDGPTLAAFTWTGKRVADALRELSDRTTYVVRIDPAKRLRMFVPATLSAPVAMTEAAPHCHEIVWRDSDRTPYNKIVVYCGPGGPAAVTDERHYGDGARRIWPLDAPFVSMIGALSIHSEGGGGYPVGIYGVDDQPWTVNLATNAMHQRADQPVVAAGDYWWISYTAQFPFTVTRSTGATPIVEYAESRPDVLSIPVGEEIADSLLAQAQEAPREATIMTDTDGFVPGQALTIALATTRSIAGTFLITSVALTIVQDTTQGDRCWQYTIEAIDSPIYQGSYLDAWREIAGVGGGSTTITGAPPGSGGGGQEEVFVGPNDPGGSLELWYDVDAPAPDSTIPDHSVTLVKLQQIPSQTLLGRATAGVGNVEVLSILPTSVQNSITRLGTVVSGVWNATPIGLTYVAGAGAAGTVVRSNGTNWATSTLLLPNTATLHRLVYATVANTYGESGNLTFTGSQLALIGNQTLTGFIGSPTYASQTTGWRIDATGGADFRYLFVDEMHAKSFITDLEMALAGGQIISKSVAMVAAPFSVPGMGATSVLRVRDLPSMADTAAFEPGDTVMLRRFSRAAGVLDIAECIGTVSGWTDQPDGTQTWVFTRNTGAEGGNMSGGLVSVDSLALDYGFSGNGYYEVNAIDGAYGANSPYAQVVTWTNAPTGANETVRARFGNLRGITGVADEYGLIAGTYRASSGSYFRASNTTFELHNITAQWWAGFTPVVVISPGGGSPYISLGNPAYPAAGQGPGIVLSYNAGVGLAQFWCYSPTGSNYLVFDGNLLYWKAANTALDAAGNLTATSASLSGAITATSGSITGDFVIGTGGQMRSGAAAFNSGIGWWLDYNGGTPRFRVGNPNADRLAWDGSGGLTVRSGKLLIDGSAGGHIGMGAAPYSIATLNIASDTDDANSYGLLVTNHAGTVATLLTYGDGRLFLGGQLYIMPGAWDQTGQGTNPPSIWNGPFGSHELSGWMRVFMYTGGGGGIPPTGPYARGWVPVWLG